MPLSAVKVVVVAQTPYPGYCQDVPIANGHALATNFPDMPAPLRKIATSIHNVEFHNCLLSGWIKQGVLLLNNTPMLYNLPWDTDTTDPNIKKLLEYPKRKWSGITERICRYIHNSNNNIDFLLIGAEFRLFAPIRHQIGARQPSVPGIFTAFHWGLLR